MNKIDKHTSLQRNQFQLILEGATEEILQFTISLKYFYNKTYGFIKKFEVKSYVEIFITICFVL